MLKRTIAAALIISSDQKVLLGKKDAKRGGVYLDKYHIPGGGVEKNETLLEALKREVLEETGVDIATAAEVELAEILGGMIAQKKLANGEVIPCEMTFHVFKVTLSQSAENINVIAGDDFAQLEWLPITELSKYPHTPPSLSLFLRVGWLSIEQVTAQREFTNANLEPVTYEGSGISWRVSAYALAIRDGKLLVAKSKHENNFDVIGGGVEIGETIEDALVREAREEGGVKIRPGKLLFSAVDWFYHRTGKFYQTLQLYYAADIIGEIGKATDPDTEKTELVPIEQIGSACKLAASPQVVAAIQAYVAEYKPFKGTIIEESLIDTRQLNDFRVRNFRITNADDVSARWHLYFVEATKENLERLAENMHPTKWYAHFWNGDDVIAVYPGKIFSFKHSQPETWKAAVEYGRKLNIPDDQLTFEIEE